MRLAGPKFDDAELAAVAECLASGWVTQGPFVDRFEAEVAERHSAKYAFATTSCTAALHMAMAALDIGPGDEVIVPAFTWVTSVHCIEYVSAKPVLVDVDPDTFNISVSAVVDAITPRTKAIIAVHLFGLAAPMDELMELAKPQGIALVEDAACAVGTQYKDRLVGTIGDVGCFSFHPRKVITTGEGGMVTVNRDDLADRVASLRNHGSTGLPSANLEPHGPWTMATFDRVGFNLRMSDIQAAVGIAQMAKLDDLLMQRRTWAERYRNRLHNELGLVLPNGDLELSAGHSFQSYVVRLRDGSRKQRNAIMSAMAEAGIETRPGTLAVHRLGYYARAYGYNAQDFPVATASEDTTITLPIFPSMSGVDHDRVCTTLIEALASYG